MNARPPGSAALIAQAAPGVPVARFVQGRSADEVLALLPRLFNLCRAAQGAAAALALGGKADRDGIAAELMRDHLLKLCVTVPAALGQAAHPLPEGWQAGGDALMVTLTGKGQAPETPQGFAAFLAGETLLAEVFRQVRDGFAPGEAVAEGLPLVDDENIWGRAPVENSVAARHADHPVMRAVEAEYGRGPFWRLTARLYDLDDAAHGRLPDLIVAPGEAVVPAARGSYALQMVLENGLVSRMTRITPTDALLMKGGILDRSLASLPRGKEHLGPLMLEILDPCSPVRLREASHA